MHILRSITRTAAYALTAGTILAATAAPAWADDSTDSVSDSSGTVSSSQVAQFEGWMVDALGQRWGAWFRSHQNEAGQQLQFTPPRVMMVNSGRQVQTRCGPLRSDTPNAFYCEGDDTIWLPLDSMVSMMQSGRFGNMDDPNLTNFDIAAIIAHEYGHYVQHELERNGVAVRTRLRTNGDVGIEDFADCAAGYWTATAANAGHLEAGDIDSGLRMLQAMGETTSTAGQADPHGTPQERHDAFLTGYTRGADICANRYLGTPLT